MRSLWPREHGAYVQLLVPLATVLVKFGINIEAMLLSLGACLAFLANEPLLVILGHRGKRSRDTDGSRARRRLSVLAPLAVVSGVGGLIIASAATHTVAAIVCVPAVLLVALGWRRQQHSLGGELLAATALTGAAAPVAASFNVPIGEIMAIWAGWSVGYGATIVAIHRVIDRHKRTVSRMDHLVTGALVVAMLVLVSIAIASRYVVVGLPLVLASVVLTSVAPPATRLRTIGFVLVATSIVSSITAVLLIG